MRTVTCVLGISIDAVDTESCLAKIDGLICNSGKGYVCFANVHGVMEAQHNQRLRKAYQDAALTAPDGMPLVWTGWMQHHSNMKRVTGPELMLEIFRDPRFHGLRHFLYGGSPGIAQELKDALLARFPSSKIVGTYTPPFRELNEVEVEELVYQLETCRADIFWVGVGCPRQEIFMAQYVDRLPVKLMFGVGAAFDYHTGRIRDCAPWIKRAGLQWMHRLLQDPWRLWKRYARTNPAFIWKICAQLWRERKSEDSPVRPEKVINSQRQGTDNLQSRA